ncbi:hypothetical protein P2Q00_30020 [Streptomyces coacervatus]|nr:hypothetical protein [Streptomyces coacervatus]MDF2269637.1 hypothetical protein [Streptomyces coacervatus]
MVAREHGGVPWWFAFNQVRGLPEKLLEGCFRHLVDEMLDLLTADRTATSDFDRSENSVHAWPISQRAGTSTPQPSR